MSDYLSDEEQVERLKSWWSENGTFLLASVVVAVLGIAAVSYTHLTLPTIYSV